ncbi:MAG: NUDIX domain-containing protein [Gammaproteobacteria bacterium]|nr:NUDIX domain-containing protein [Gammaproteobacteria bacterium]
MSDDEWFEIFDANGQLLGEERRAHVHREGFWHKSAHVFLFDAANRLYVQRRTPDKDLYAGLWDYSVGEHLIPGESYLAGARRGLLEELGISGVELSALGGVQASRNETPGIRDFELQQAYRGTYEGPLQPDPSEVSEMRKLHLDELERWLRREPDVFTPWFARDLAKHGFLPGTASKTTPNGDC